MLNTAANAADEIMRAKGYHFGVKGALAFTAALFLAGCGGGAARRSDGAKGAAIAAHAIAQTKTPYRFGGRSPEKGFDCSGLAWWSHRQAGLPIPQTARSQFFGGKMVSRQALSPGDLVFFKIGGKVLSHVGIYAGGGNFLHAPSSGGVVKSSSLRSSYWKRRFIGARRYW